MFEREKTVKLIVKYDLPWSSVSFPFIGLSKLQSLFCFNEDFEHALTPPEEAFEFLYNLKADPLPYERAVAHKEKTMVEINNMVEWADNHLPEDNGYEKAKKFLDDLSVDIFYASLN